MSFWLRCSFFLIFNIIKMVEELKTKVEAVADDDGEGQEELEAKVKDLADTYKYKMEEDKNQTKEDFNNSLNNELNKIELAKLQSSKEKIETRLQALNNIESKTNEINVQITSLEAILTSIESTIKSKQTLDEGIQGNTNQKTSIKVETQTETPEQRANGFIDTFLKADDAGRGALSNLLKQDWNKTYLTSLSIAVANRISNHPNIEKSDPLNFLQQYVNGLLNKTDMQERIEKGEEKATKIVENVKQLFDYFTKGEFMKAIFKLFEAW
jgi:DNA repair exonuclease SbcCD ATPase subunit